MTARWGGAFAIWIRLSGAEPTLLSPSWSHSSPISESQPSGARRRVARSARHFSRSCSHVIGVLLSEATPAVTTRTAIASTSVFFICPQFPLWNNSRTWTGGWVSAKSQPVVANRVALDKPEFYNSVVFSRTTLQDRSRRSPMPRAFLGFAPVLILISVLTGCSSGPTAPPTEATQATQPQTKPASLYSGLQAFGCVQGLALKWASDNMPVRL